MCNFCEINDQNSCNSYKMNIKSQKRIKLTNYKVSGWLVWLVIQIVSNNHFFKVENPSLRI